MEGEARNQNDYSGATRCPLVLMASRLALPSIPCQARGVLADRADADVPGAGAALRGAAADDVPREHRRVSSNLTLKHRTDLLAQQCRVVFL